MAASVSLNWRNRIIGADSIKVYRDTATFDINSLPSGGPIATLSDGVEEYTDTGAPEDTEVFYGVSVVFGSKETLSEVISVYTSSPGTISSSSSGGAFASFNGVLLYMEAGSDKVVDLGNTVAEIPWDAGLAYGSATVADWWDISTPNRVVVPTGVTRAKVTVNVRFTNDSSGDNMYCHLDYRPISSSGFGADPRPLFCTDGGAWSSFAYDDTYVLDGPWFAVEEGDQFNASVRTQNAGRNTMNSLGTYLLVEYE